MIYEICNNYEIIKNRLYINSKKINTNSIIKYTCRKCKKEYIVKYRTYMKDFTLCKMCKTKQTNLEKYGSENAFQYSKNKIKQTKLEKYGDENYNNKEQTKQTNLKKYGSCVPIPFHSDKHDEIMIKKYGVKNAQQNNEIKQKTKNTFKIKYNGIGLSSNLISNRIKKTNLEKYNVEYPLQSFKIRNKIKEKININTIKKYYATLKNSFIIPLFSEDEFLNIYTKEALEKNFKWKCTNCNKEFYDHVTIQYMPKCPTCTPHNKSKTERELTNWCHTFTTTIENNSSIIKPYEIDIYLPDYKLAIEYNGLYWHNIDHVDKWYHQRKVELAYRKGIRLLHVWEYEDMEEIKEVIQYYINNMDEFIKVEKPKLYNIENNLIWI